MDLNLFLASIIAALGFAAIIGLICFGIYRWYVYRYRFKPQIRPGVTVTWYMTSKKNPFKDDSKAFMKIEDVKDNYVAGYLFGNLYRTYSIKELYDKTTYGGGYKIESSNTQENS